ncbi:hypothetical protein L596_002381 [Steinernema carpocapsae]|nr:hypothetical protein L596_002381 [Steinernema carpocapsae]
MNNLETILDLLKQEENTLLAGVNTCYLYYGMWKTSFAWHSEDVDLYSINYLHYGAPKFWYSISSEYAERFERLASQLQPDYSSRCRNFLRHKTFIVHPSLLDKYSIPYTTMVQYPGEFMITFPKGYHMGFNMGFNCAESTNFAMDRWIDYGKNASLCTCANKRGHVKINMIPFMQKYRAKEFELWKRYWYDNEFSNIAEAIQLVQSNDDEKPKEVVKPKKRTQGSREHAEKLFVYGDATPLWSDLCVDFEGERRFNLKRSFAFPFCAVCQYFYPEPLAHHVEKVPYWSPRHVSDLMFSKNPNDPNLNKRRNNVRKNLDRMMYECADCGIMVHCGCYPVGVDIDQARMAAAQNDLQVSGNRDLAPMKFRCLRCREAKEIIKLSASCHLCSMRGGALIPAHKGRDKNRFVHIVCALMNRKTWFANTDTRVLAITETPRKQGSDAIESPLLTKYKNAVTEDYDQALFECEVCHGQSEGLISCLRCDETRPFLYHATCARALGLVMQRRDWPITTAMMCQNDANTFKDPTEPTFRRLHVAENVICWLNEGAQVETGTVTQINEVECCAVIFMDGSISTEVAPMDIITCACMKLAAGKENTVADDPDADEYEGPIFHADHKHVIGARCFVPWNDGRNYAAFFQGQGKVDRYVIQPDSGEEPLILTRGDLYGEDDYIPDIVLSKLPASKRGRVRKNSDRGGKNTKRRRNDAA